MSSMRIKVEKCYTCDKPVYAQERMEADGKVFHKGCMKCKECLKPLGLGNFAAMGGEFYCKPHFKQLFKLKGNYDEGFGKTKHSMRWVRPADGSSPIGSPMSDPRRVAIANEDSDEHSSPSPHAERPPKEVHSSPAPSKLHERSDSHENLHSPAQVSHSPAQVHHSPAQVSHSPAQASHSPAPVSQVQTKVAAMSPKPVEARHVESEEEKHAKEQALREQREADEKRVAERRAKLLEERRIKMEAQREEERKKIEELKQVDPNKAALLEKQQNQRYRRASIAKLADGGALVSIKDRYREAAGGSSPVPAKLVHST